MIHRSKANRGHSSQYAYERLAYMPTPLRRCCILKTQQERGHSEDNHVYDPRQGCISSLPRCVEEHRNIGSGSEEARIPISYVGDEEVTQKDL